MELIVLVNIKDEKDFVAWLVKRIKCNWTNFIKSQKLSRLSEYINSDECKIHWIGNRKRYLDIYNLLSIGINNLCYEVYPNKFKIYIDKRVYLPFTYTRIYDIISLVNYGNLEIDGCGIITDIMDYIKDNLKTLYLLYLEDTGKCQ